MGSVQQVEILKMVWDWDWSVSWLPLGNIKGENSENGEHTKSLYLGGLFIPSVEGKHCES